MESAELERSRARDFVVVIGGLAIAVAIASLVAVIARRHGLAVQAVSGGAARHDVAVRTSTRAHALPLGAEKIDEVVAAPAERRVPLDVLRTASVTASPWAPGLRLQKSVLAGEWEGRRAQIEDRTTGDVRAYAIGDLLPHGSLLVGVSTTTADILVADAHLVRLHDNGRVEPLQDLSKADEPIALQPVRVQDPDYEDKLRVALVDLRSADPSVVQAAIDELIAGGDPAVEMLMPQVESVVPVRSAEYAFPAGSGVEMRPRVVGEVVMMVLERITGQTFGDLSREDLSDEQRHAIAGAWKRWWGAR